MTVNYKKIFFIFMYFLAPAGPIAALFSANPERYNNKLLLVAMIVGSASYTWLVIEFILSSKPVMIEKLFGLDKIYRFHGQMAIASVLLVFIHRAILNSLFDELLIKQLGTIAFVIFTIVSLVAILFMVHWISDYISFLKIRLQVKYELLVRLHNLAKIGLVLMLIHVLLTSNVQKHLQVKLVFILYFIIGLSAYVYSNFIKDILAKNNNLFKISEVIQESDKIYTLKLMPVNGRIFDFIPGQFAYLKIRRENVNIEKHPFTISSAPANRSFISFTIKQLGDFTSTIKDIKIDSKVLIDGPYGKFILPKPLNKNLVLIAGGIGITPMLSILRNLRETGIENKVTLLWGVKSRSDLICYSEIDDIKKDFKNFKFTPVLSNDPSWEGEKGRIDRRTIEAACNDFWEAKENTLFYICGPYGMMKSVLDCLSKLGISKGNIHYEKFTI